MSSGTAREHVRVARAPRELPVIRLYRATADSYSILAKDGRPDHRIAVPLGGPT
jgi:hypothetical protein